MKNKINHPRPKQARAVATRRNLLDATVRVLCEHGYSGMTTTIVAESAGVSQGALYKHFGSKHQLVAATTEHLFARLIEEFRRVFATGGSEDERISVALRELWAIFVMPELYAVLELYMAARTVEPLRQALLPVLLIHRENLMSEARRFFPEAAANNPRFVECVDAVMMAMQGAAISAAVVPELKDGSQVVPFLEYLAKREFETPYGVEE